ncbi:delta 9-fatty acid desaturase protein [Armillaria mellea]|nr:delta 9-fatty acid desaturase protein [Armillaria mellea]
MRITIFDNFPPIKGVRWFNVWVFIVTPLLGMAGFFYAPSSRATASFSVLYYVFSMLGVTAGYHRLWSHRSYNASIPLQLFLLAAGTSAAQGSALFWSRSHRSHHRYTDTDKDPYNANRGFWWNHLGWMVFITDLHSGPADASDLKKDKLLQLQHSWYFTLLPIWAIIVPTVIPGYFWGDWIGGFCFATMLRMTFAHHSTFALNSVAHYLGSAPFDDRLTPRDHFITAIVTMGEGYHNFHHQFPMDYRNAIRWYQFDPTKWFIAACKILGFASHLRTFSGNEIKKGQLTMKLKNLKRVQEEITWPMPTEKLPVITWDTFQKESKDCPLILIAGFIHDVSSFIKEHPGGSEILKQSAGKDMTPAFFGGVYDHSNAAHNLLSMLRVGVLENGVETLAEPVKPEHAIPPSQSLYVAARRQLI